MDWTDPTDTETHNTAINNSTREERASGGE